MTRRTAIVVALSASMACACGAEPAPAIEPAPPLAARTVEPVRDDAPPVPPLADDVRLPFRWFEGVTSVASFGASIGASSHVHEAIVGDERTYAARRDGDAIVVARTNDAGIEAWSVRLEGPFTSEPVIADLSMSDDAILIAATGPAGWIVEAREERDGARRWRASAPVSGSEGVQLGVEPSGIAVYVRATGGDVVDLIDATEGRVIGRRTFDPAITRIALDRPETASVGQAGLRATWPAREPGVTWNATEGRVRSGPSRLLLMRAHDDDSQIVWTMTDASGCVDLALAEGEGEIVVASYCRMATGVTVHAIQVDTAIERWEVRPFGYGPIAHSRWSNEVAIAIDGPYVRVWGAESGGRYVSTIDRASGRELATIVRRPPPIQP